MDNINTKLYWNTRFSTGDWNSCNGGSQTKFFAKLILQQMPIAVKKHIENMKFSILDFGCATGELCNVFKKEFKNSRITGVDFSSEAIRIAQKHYPDIEFNNMELSSQDKHDVVVTSNTLEHILEWESYLYMLSHIAQEYIVLLLPYQSAIFDEHVVSFTDSHFKSKIGMFYKRYVKIINTDGTGYWNGNQMLIIYTK